MALHHRFGKLPQLNLAPGDLSVLPTAHPGPKACVIVSTMGLKTSPSGETFRFLYWMENFNLSSQSRYDIYYHFMWLTKYSRSILDQMIMEYIRQQEGIEPSGGDDNSQVTNS